eukprot:CAMPEP_0119550832 /NCGR_PEP_ID=MMETSP1352-20130426/4275_1 /TAXON_ID=265584 /ORGANISM="Stauroneis constricta, Strain CCMP1120" /LENGTH=643 /DNA_ID=CAMNT_0007596803 /DNA_START=145 /DNA_END=2076 /DNA_ORIENTATION=+
MTGYDAYAACLTSLDLTDGDISSSSSSNNSTAAADLLICVTNTIQQHANTTTAQLQEYHDYTRTLYIILAAALVFFMQAGFAMVCAGSVRRKNLQNTMLKNLLDACWASVGFFTVGFAFAFGDRTGKANGFIGTANFFLLDVEDYSFWLFQYTFSAAAATIVAGTLAERCKMAAYISYSIFVSGFVYPIVVHAVWSDYGFLSITNDASRRIFNLEVGVIDFAGCGVVHLTGGAVALVATWILGARRGVFHDELSGEELPKPRKIVGHSISLQMVGTLILWFCWYGFNSGSALLLTNSDHQSVIAALAATNTTLSAGTAGIVALITNMLLQRKPVHSNIIGTGSSNNSSARQQRRQHQALYDLNPTLNGVLSGLVAITGACGVVEPWCAVLIGTVAGWIYLFGAWLLLKCKLDDAVNGIPIHMMNGIWGLLAVGIFANSNRVEQAYGISDVNGVLTSVLDIHSTIDGRLLSSQCVAIIFISIWTMAIMFPFFMILSKQGYFRILPNHEMVGLDQSFHGGRNNALTIQQFTIYQNLLAGGKDDNDSKLRKKAKMLSKEREGSSNTNSEERQQQQKTSQRRILEEQDGSNYGDDDVSSIGSINDGGDDGAGGNGRQIESTPSSSNFRRIDMTGDLTDGSRGSSFDE